MAKFIFKMQNILEIKRKLEDQAKSVYADALAVLDREQNKLKLLETKKDEYERRLTQMMSDVLELEKIKFNEDAIEFRGCFSLKRFRKCPEGSLPKILARFCAEC